VVLCRILTSRASAVCTTTLALCRPSTAASTAAPQVQSASGAARPSGSWRVHPSRAQHSSWTSTLPSTATTVSGSLLSQHVAGQDFGWHHNLSNTVQPARSPVPIFDSYLQLQLPRTWCMSDEKCRLWGDEAKDIPMLLFEICNPP